MQYDHGKHRTKTAETDLGSRLLEQSMIQSINSRINGICSDPLAIGIGEFMGFQLALSEAAVPTDVSRMGVGRVFSGSVGTLA